MDREGQQQNNDSEQNKKKLTTSCLSLFTKCFGSNDTAENLVENSANPTIVVEEEAPTAVHNPEMMLQAGKSITYE
jgi:hypothetical protein